MGKNILSEDINKMMGLIKYDRSKSLTENLMEQASDATVGSAGVRRAYTGKDIAKTALYASGLGLPIAAAWDIWDWATDTWGSKDKSTRLSAALNKTAWPTIEKAIKETSYKAGEDLSEKLTVISASEAKGFANDLYEAMDGAGTYEDDIRDVFDNLGSMMDVSRVSYEYGTKEGYDLNGWLDDELSSSDYSKVVANPMRKKPLAVYDGKLVNTVEDLVKLIAESSKDEDSERAELWKGKECVLVTAESNGGKWSDDGKSVLITIEGAQANFHVDGRFAYKGPGYKDGAEVLKGEFSCKGDELKFGEGDLALAEGRLLTQTLITKIKNYYLSEQIVFGDVILPVPEGEEGDEEGGEEEEGGGEEEGGDEEGGAKSKEQNKCDWTQILAGKCVAKKGQQGDVITVVQEKLDSSWS